MSDIVERLRGPVPSIPAMRDGANQIISLRYEIESLRSQLSAERQAREQAELEAADLRKNRVKELQIYGEQDDLIKALLALGSEERAEKGCDFADGMTLGDAAANEIVVLRNLLQVAKDRALKAEALLREAQPFIGYQAHVPDIKERIDAVLKEQEQG